MSGSFCAAVESMFDTLVLKHGFRVTKFGRNLIALDSANVGIEFFYDDLRSFKVVLALRHKSHLEAQPAYSFDELLRALNVPANEWSTGYSASTDDAAATIVKRMIGILERHAVRLLDADPASWVNLSEQRRADCIAYAATTKMVHIKRVADEAWASKNYRQVVRELEAAESELGKVDAAKLAYAKRILRS